MSRLSRLADILRCQPGTRDEAAWPFSFFNSAKFLKMAMTWAAPRPLIWDVSSAEMRLRIKSHQTYLLDFSNVRCITCHNQNPRGALPVGVGSSRLIFADQRLTDSQHVKTPHLRNLYQKTGFTNSPGSVSIAGFGFSHDGRDSTLFNISSRRASVR